MKAYLSSTFADLEEHRDHARRALQSLGIQVVAMEDYVARDERPVDRCLADVASADLYVGLFAFRYGHVPTTGNPDDRSITELEYRHAVECGVTCLLFLAREDARWSLQFVDGHTGENARGDRINALRAELSGRMVGWFRTPDQLEAEVAKAATNWLLQQHQIPRSDRTAPAPVAPHPRQLQYDLLLLHASVDGEQATALAQAISDMWRVKTSHTGLVADSIGELKELDRLATAARSAAVLLSPSSRTVLAEDRVRSGRTLGLVRDRTGGLLGIALEDVADADAWGLSRQIGPTSPAGVGDVAGLATQLHMALAHDPSPAQGPEIGLPVTVVAMTAAEATDLFADAPPPIAALLELTGGSSEPWTTRYGTARSRWRPFEATGETIEEVLAARVAEVNRDVNQLQGRTIRLQPYPLDALLRDNLKLWPVYQAVARSGCLVVVDELSLFHPAVRQVFETSPLPTGGQIAFVTLSPLDATAGPPHATIRNELDGRLTDATRRFREVLDPLCEIGVMERRRLDRWLHGSLPRAVDALRQAQRDPEKLRELQEELGTSPNPALGRLIAGERGA
jgi:hypothetical protein